MLNTPKGDLVMSEDFLPMVKRLDECLEYLGSHVSFSAHAFGLTDASARLQRRRSLLAAISAVYDEEYDLD